MGLQEFACTVAGSPIIPVKHTTLNWSRFRTAMVVRFDYAGGWCAKRELTVGDQVR